MLVRRAAVAAVVLAPFLMPAAAGAAEPVGVLCGYGSFSDPRTPDTQAGEIDAGPLVLDPDPAGQPVWGSVTCTVHVSNDRHSGPAAASVTSDVTPGVVALPSTLVSYPAGDGDYVVVCTRVDVVGRGTYYWNPDATGEGDGSWSTDPESSCAQYPGTRDPLRPVWAAVDPLVCPAFAVVFPPEGDIEGIWDCPPYGS